MAEYIVVKETGRQKSVSLFKGVAIIMVVLVHLAQSFPLPDWAGYLPKLGQMGCQIFFVLSAYTLCHSLDRNNCGTVSFLKNRYRRILPGYWTMILAYLALGVLSVVVFGKNLFGTSMNWPDVLVNLLLLNGVVPGTANNLVVRGGWYVGTSIIFYFMMPILYRIFHMRSNKWEKHRLWLFPLSIAVLSSAAVIVSGCIDSRFLCGNNSFIYFSFVNQLPSFAIGFSLYDWNKNRRGCNKTLSVIACGVFLALSIGLFFSNTKFAFVFVPTLFSAAFCCLFSLMYDRIERSSNQKALLHSWSKYSYAVYLTHTLIVYEGSRAFILIMKRCFGDLSPVLLLAVWLPIAYIIVYYTGKIFTKYLDYLGSKITK